MFNGQRILVLEEQESIAQLLAEMLVALNCIVIGPADRLPEALAMLVQHDVDAAILDVKIQGEPSYPVAEELIRRGIPWAFTTGNDASELAEHYSGVPIIAKPYSSAQIELALQRLLASPSR